MTAPKPGDRYMRADPFDPTAGDYNGYTVLFVTNIAHVHDRHPPQVVYQGDNGRYWSLPLEVWPGRLKQESPQ
jgi:hypothetical protein